MTLSLKQFRSTFLDELIALLWSQWSSLGVPGVKGSDAKSVIDPEALLLLTCSIGRYDPRLFDEMMTWLYTHGRFINIQRLRAIINKYDFSGTRVLSAIAKIVSKKTSMKKWGVLIDENNKSISPESLFFMKEGSSIPQYGSEDKDFANFGLMRGPFKIDHQANDVIATKTNVVYQLRSLIGANARCEIITYLMSCESSHPSQIARDTCYYQKTIQDALIDMVCSGLIFVESRGKEKLYHVKKRLWIDFLLGHTAELRWINWVPIFLAYEHIWAQISNAEFFDLSPIAQSSELRRIMIEVTPHIQRANFGHKISDTKKYLGTDYSNIFMSDIMTLITETK